MAPAEALSVASVYVRSYDFLAAMFRHYTNRGGQPPMFETTLSRDVWDTSRHSPASIRSYRAAGTVMLRAFGADVVDRELPDGLKAVPPHIAGILNPLPPTVRGDKGMGFAMLKKAVEDYSRKQAT